MSKILIDGTPKRMSTSGYSVKAVLVQDDETEIPVYVQYDYTPGRADQGNPDLPNPGPGNDAGIDITEITDVNGEQFDPVDVEFDVEEFLDTTQEMMGESVNWNLRMAGL